MNISKKNKKIFRKKRKNTKKYKGGSNVKESILIILSSNEMNPEFIPQIISLSKYIEHLSKMYNVEVAGISSKDDFINYSPILNFKYKYVNDKPQLSKICAFISDNKNTLKYDWYVKIRPEIELLDYDSINFQNLPKDSISARAREYLGPQTNKYSCSVGGEGTHKGVKNCVRNNELKKIVLDDNIYIFHKNVIDKGGFERLDPANNVKQHHEWLHSDIWTSRNIKLNLIGINTKFSRKKSNNIIYSGNVI